MTSSRTEIEINHDVAKRHAATDPVKAKSNPLFFI